MLFRLDLGKEKQISGRIRIGKAGCFRCAATAMGMQWIPAFLGAFTPGSTEKARKSHHAGIGEGNK